MVTRANNEPFLAEWDPDCTIHDLLSSVYTMLREPSDVILHCMTPAVADEFRTNRQAYDATAREWTERHARPAAPMNAMRQERVEALLPVLTVMRERGATRDEVETAFTAALSLVYDTS